ncbi:Uncharacterised protein [uncultured archaeon]|nr:Uncharacterised protein [uncultured archaeon]
MELAELDSIVKWLNITQQQHDVLSCIYALEEQKSEINPKNILDAYKKTYSKSIQPSNLFPLLKTLVERDIIIKKEKANYALNSEGIRNQLLTSQRIMQKELEDQTYVIDHIDEYFKSIANHEKQPILKYYSYTDGFEKLAEILKSCKKHYCTSTFPYIAWMPTLAYQRGVEAYNNVLWERCLTKKVLEVTYLTPLDMDLLYSRAMKVFGVDKLAYAECESMLNKVEALLERNENLDIKYLENPVGFFVMIPERNSPTDVFIFLRDENREVIGYIYINSEDIAYQAKQQFLSESKHAVSLRDPKGKVVLKKIRKQFAEKYAHSK